MTLEQWQTLLRRQFGRDQDFTFRNLGSHPAFSEFLVDNPKSQRSYRVAIRGRQTGENSCNCMDFATNSLGTCKHIEFVLGKLESRKAARSELARGFHPPSGEIYLRYGDRRTVCFREPAAMEAAYRTHVRRFFDADGALRPESLADFDEFLAGATFHDAELKVADDALDYLAEIRDGRNRVDRVKEAFPRGIRSAAFKDLLKTPLYNYQREGVLFAASAGRCLIGDEMGLGKTIQAIGAAEAMARLYGIERTLVVCPTSLKHQWRTEIAKFTQRPALVVEGMKHRRAEAYADPAPFFKIANYDTVHMDLDAIAAWGPDLVILDEAQRIKNWSTRTARSVKRIRTPYAVVLTGTPLENRLEELISIVQFVDPHRLGPTYRLLHDHQVRDEFGKVTGYRDLDRIGQTLAPVLLRRQKDQVLDQLPKRIDSTVFVPMTPRQREIHSENHDIVVRVVAKWRSHRFLSEADKRRLMTALQYMRMSCDSSYLVDPETEQGLKVNEIMTVLDELLERPGAKAVVFSQWLRMHELLVKAARKRGIGHVLFHGGLDGRERGKLIERFRNEPETRLFLSTDAGGVGLNLQFANVVVNADLPWNPAVLEQRIGRVHRLGQEQPVRVVNFVAKDSIEESMLGVLKFKKSLFAGVLDGGDANISFGGSRLTKFMETIEATTANIPAAQPHEREEAAEAKREFRPDPKPEAAPPGDPWSALMEAGAAALRQLTQPSGNGSLVRTDERTGESYLRLPVSSAKAMTDVLAAVGKLLETIRT